MPPKKYITMLLTKFQMSNQRFEQKRKDKNDKKDVEWNPGPSKCNDRKAAREAARSNHFIMGMPIV